MYKANKIEGADLRFVVPKHVQPIRDAVLKFVEEKVYPLEAKLDNLPGDHPDRKTMIKAMNPLPFWLKPVVADPG